MNSTASSFAPVAAATGDPIRLAMQRLWLTGQVLPAGAHLVIEHVFQSEEERPLEVIYSFALPRDAALRGFRITGDGFDTSSELMPTEEAVKVYEHGIARGSLSALARQYGDGLVNLTVGNLRPKETVTVRLEILAGVELRDDGFRFRFPFTLAPAHHPRVRAAVVDGEGEMELPFREFGDVILPRFRQDASSRHQIGFQLSLTHQLPLAAIGSPSHQIMVKQEGTGRTSVALAPEKDVPNRDLVLNLLFEEKKPQILAGRADGSKLSFALIVPSTIFGQPESRPRRAAILLDRSGSMQGEPISQARRAVEACLAAMSEEDSFLLLGFDDHVEAMHSTLLPATREHRERARAFLNQLDARGGTELAAGVQAAARALGKEGDILIITDGQVFGTEAILKHARATGIRLFCLGIGSASRDRFLSLLARETGGIGRFVTARERVDLAAIDLFASMGQPAASGLKSSHAQPEPPHGVFAGTPVLLSGEMENDSANRVDLSWNGGCMSFDLPPGDARIESNLQARQPRDVAGRSGEARRRPPGRVTRDPRRPGWDATGHGFLFVLFPGHIGIEFRANVARARSLLSGAFRIHRRTHRHLKRPLIPTKCHRRRKEPDGQTHRRSHRPCRRTRTRRRNAGRHYRRARGANNRRNLRVWLRAIPSRLAHSACTSRGSHSF
jgi:hypothetical protein